MFLYFCVLILIQENMKKLLYFSAIVCTVLLLLSGCNHSEKFRVTLNLENADGRTLFLCKTVEGTDVVVDSVVVSGNQVVLNVTFDDPQTLYIIKFDKNASCEIFPFFTENQNTTISGDIDDMPHWTISGCPAMNELSAFHEKSAELYENRIMAVYAEMAQSDSAKVEELNAQVQPIIKEYFDYQVDFIKSHSDSYIGHFMLDQMKKELDFELVKELAAGFTNESAFSKSVQKFIENGPQMESPCCTVQ